MKCDSAIHRGRQAVLLSNDAIEVVLLPGGGHVAAIRPAGLGLNPLWEPPWPTVEPEEYKPGMQSTCGTGEGRLLASLAGHFVCLDHFGELSEAEIRAGGYFHGEAPNLPWQIFEQSQSETQAWLTYGLHLPEAALNFKRRVSIGAAGTVVSFEEEIVNLRRRDVALSYQQHVTVGPPFLEGGVTRIDLPGLRGRTFPRPQGPADRLLPDRDFLWPLAAGLDSEVQIDIFPSQAPSCSMSTVLLAPDSDEAFVAIGNSRLGLLLGYLFPRELFPWTAIWEENQAATEVPYLGRTLAWGVEFGSTPLPLTSMENLAAGPLFGRRRFLVLPAAGVLRAKYRAFLRALPSDWAGVERISRNGNQIVIWEKGSTRKLLVS